PESAVDRTRQRRPPAASHRCPPHAPAFLMPDLKLLGVAHRPYLLDLAAVGRSEGEHGERVVLAVSGHKTGFAVDEFFVDGEVGLSIERAEEELRDGLWSV